MTQQPFTTAGVQAMMSELQALSPSDLQTQVNLIRSDLKSWVGNNFTLDTDEQSYLNSIDSRFFEYASGVTAFAIGNGLNVSLTKPNNTKPLKLIHVNDNVVVTFSGDGTTTITGGVTYVVEYQ